MGIGAEALNQWSSPGFDGFDLSKLASAGAAGAVTGALGAQRTLGRLLLTGVINTLDGYYRAECRVAYGGQEAAIDFVSDALGGFAGDALGVAVRRMSPVARYLNRSISRLSANPNWVVSSSLHSSFVVGSMQQALEQHYLGSQLLVSELVESLISER